MKSETINVIQYNKSMKDIYNDQVEGSLDEHRRSKFGVFISALSAGLEVGFSVYCIVMVISLFTDILHPNTLHVLKSLAYSVGFLFVTLSRSELFTEQTALSVLPVLNKKATLKSLGKLWSAVFSGNMVGGLLFSIFILQLNTSLSFIDTAVFEKIALGIISYPSFDLFLSAITAGWLMALLSWMSTACSTTSSRIFIVILVTFIIGFGNLHHSILGAVEVMLGLMTSETITLSEALRFQFWVTTGNAVGGVFFVAVLKSSFMKFSKKAKKTTPA